MTDAVNKEVNLVNYSPLRYPGGKNKITPLIRLIIEKAGCAGTTYIEPFAGGAGVALSLLIDGVVNQIVINDYDKAVYSFWRALKETPQELINLEVDEETGEFFISEEEREPYFLNFTFSPDELNKIKWKLIEYLHCLCYGGEEYAISEMSVPDGKEAWRKSRR